MSIIGLSSPVLVIDANVALWAVLPVLQDPRVNALARFQRWRSQGIDLVAPDLWLAEATSATRRAIFTKRISAERGQQAIGQLFALEIESVTLDDVLCKSALEWAARINQSKAYDAFYLAVADRLGVEFWTADERLANAARAAGVAWAHWIGESS